MCWLGVWVLRGCLCGRWFVREVVCEGVLRVGVVVVSWWCGGSVGLVLVGWRGVGVARWQ